MVIQLFSPLVLLPSKNIFLVLFLVIHQISLRTQRLNEILNSHLRLIIILYGTPMQEYAKCILRKSYTFSSRTAAVLKDRSDDKILDKTDLLL